MVEIKSVAASRRVELIAKEYKRTFWDGENFLSWRVCGLYKCKHLSKLKVTLEIDPAQSIRQQLSATGNEGRDLREVPSEAHASRSCLSQGQRRKPSETFPPPHHPYTHTPSLAPSTRPQQSDAKGSEEALRESPFWRHKYTSLPISKEGAAELRKPSYLLSIAK